MKGYGYSIWLVPDNWRHIKKEFSMDFIPHITIATNLPYLPYGILDNKKSYKVKNFENGTVFPKMYKVDPLNAYGYYCEIEEMYLNHKPHMTLFYAPNPITYLDTFSIVKAPPKEMNCTLAIADTNSTNPSQWGFI